MTLSTLHIDNDLRAGSSCENEVLEYHLGRISRFEPIVQAFAAFDEQRVRSEYSQSCGRGRLAGRLVAIKDVIDTADYPTEFFSPIYEGRRPARDAWIVSRLKAAGAVIIGKTHTAEFAYSHTGPTRNPYALENTPGSSSAGSAAGLAAGFFPLALGTQTAGSVLKPASYCGVFAFKPTFGRVPLESVLAHAPSFDTAGWFARSVEDLSVLADVLMPAVAAAPTIARNGIGWCDTPYPIDSEVEAALLSARTTLVNAGRRITSFELPAELSTVASDHVIINEAEASRSLSEEVRGYPDLVSPEVLQAYNRAQQRGPIAEEEARARLRRAQPALFGSILSRYDAVLAPTCGITAPPGLASTGPSDHIRLWTAFGLPLVNIPLPRPPGKLPIGMQIIGAPGTDSGLLELAHGIAIDLGISRAEIIDPARCWCRIGA